MEFNDYAPLIVMGAVILFLSAFWIVVLGACFGDWLKSKRLTFEGGNKAIVKAIINRAKSYKPYEWSKVGFEWDRVSLPDKAIETPPIVLGDHEFRVILFKRTFGKVGYLLYQDEVYSILRCGWNSYVLSEAWKYWKDSNFKVPTEMERAFFETSQVDSGALTVVE